tara:strand:+ start:37 stop:1560 length:1524 start_codon:yes stop_codon:yes gene_type:complete
MLGTINILRVIIAVTLVLSPALVWLVSGVAPPFAQRGVTEFPTLGAIIGPDNEAREQLADAFADRSLARKGAIGLLNTIKWRVFGFIDDDRIVSGNDGVLFYKQQFSEWSCERREINAVSLDRMLFFSELASVADVDFVIAIAPNKASVLREAVTGLAGAYVGCYDETESRLRTIVSNAPEGSIIDHTPPMQAAADRASLFFRTDTHWTTNGGVRALNQFFDETGTTFGPGFLAATPRSILRTPDLASSMLQIPMLESDIAYNFAPRLVERSEVQHQTVLHDSFYARIRDALSAGFWQSDFVYINRSPESDLISALERSSSVVLQRVERRLLAEFQSNGVLSHDGRLLQWLIDRNSEAAAHNCVYDDNLEFDDVELRRVEGTTLAALRVISDDPILIFSAPEYSGQYASCLRFSLASTGNVSLRLYFPGARFARLYGPYSEGRVLEFNGNDEISVELMLPPLTQTEVRLDPTTETGDFQVTNLAYGRVLAEVLSDEREPVSEIDLRP